MEYVLIMVLTPTDSGIPPVRLRRHWRQGLRSLYGLARGTGGLANSYDAVFALAGPTVEKEFLRFAQHPVGRQLLSEHPRRDLNGVLSDRESLMRMPPGSFAHAYLVYMGDEGMGSANDFLRAAGLEEKAARFGWTEEQLWFVRRMANSHDLFHVIAGYDRSIVGEIGVNAYTAGQIPLVPLKLLMVYLFLLKPSRPIGWTQFVSRSYRHGRDTPPLSCANYEELLGRPLEEVRQILGVLPLSDVHPEGLPSRGQALRRLERNLAMGGEQAKAKL